MRDNLALLGSDWLADEVDNIVETIEHITPAEFNEQNRYLPDSVTPLPGFIRFDINPYMREIVDTCDPRSPVREVNLMKGVQITYTTALESILLYYIAHMKTRPAMMVSADKELVKGRIENYILPMLNQSDMSHLIQSSDEGNSRKTGKTASHLQWEGGGFLVPEGANNAAKMRMWSILLMLKDEIDGWPIIIGKDGDPDQLTDDRCSAFWENRKIYRGSTPTVKATSKIWANYLRGDQRQYMVLCRQCSYPQWLRWETKNKDNGLVGGLRYEVDNGMLVPESVRYCCAECGHEHFERDKIKLFSHDEGAHWKPTANPAEPNIRSYHLPAMYSPYGFASWAKCVADYLKGFDPVQRKVKDIGKYQVFYNNILGMPFDVRGEKVRFESVSAHRRTAYKFGEIPNDYALTHSDSEILFLTCQVDVHKGNLAVAVMGWTRHMRCYVIDYWRYEDDDCTDVNSKVWRQLSKLIEEKTYTSANNKRYRLTITLIDSGYAADTVATFCGKYGTGVYPIKGVARPAKARTITEFGVFTMAQGVQGYRVVVDHYKDRMSTVLRRDWVEGEDVQSQYHFNAPVDMSDSQLKELTVEDRRKVTDAKGAVDYVWHRPGNARNELWDLLGYGYAAVEIFAHAICIQHYELEQVEWVQFWGWLEANPLYESVG
jgi:phage terminase large subunit GpA-like protein